MKLNHKYYLSTYIAIVLMLITSTALAVSPDIKANGSDGPVNVLLADNLSVIISLDPESSSGVDCDWWVAVNTPFGWYYFDVVIMNWAYAGTSYTDLSHTHQGQLFNLSPFEILKISGLPEGTYTFYFAVDTIVNGLLDGSLYYDSVIVNIISTDNTPPAVKITSPVNGTKVSGTISVSATASDNVAVERVEFYVDGLFKSNVTTEPYGFNLNTASMTDGNHTIKATAYDTSTNSASDTVTVDVNKGQTGIIDKDGDGVPDSDDQCPGYDDTIDFDGDGEPDGCDTDDDNDGVSDADDQCQDTLPNTYVSPDGCSLTGRELLFSREFVKADDFFQDNLIPEDFEANFFRSLTRLIRIIEQNQDGSDLTTFTDSLKEILDQFGFSPGGRSIFDFFTSPPEDSQGHTVLPSDSPTGGDLQEFLRNVVLPEISGAIEENLMSIDKSFSLIVTIEEMAGLGISDDTPVEIDYGEVKLLEAGLNGLKAAILTFLAYDLNMDIDQANNLGDSLKIQQDIIDANTSLLKLTSDGAALLAQAREAIIDGINAYTAGSSFIRKETDDQNDDFITIELDDLLEEASLRAELKVIKKSLSGGPSTVTIMNTLVNISQLFDFPFDLRDFLPPIAFSPERENYIVPGTFPDPTFNGILPGMTQDELADDLDIE